MNLVIVKGNGGTALAVQKDSHYGLACKCFCLLCLALRHGSKVFCFLALVVRLPNAVAARNEAR